MNEPYASNLRQAIDAHRDRPRRRRRARGRHHIADGGELPEHLMFRLAVNHAVEVCARLDELGAFMLSPITMRRWMVGDPLPVAERAVQEPPWRYDVPDWLGSDPTLPPAE